MCSRFEADRLPRTAVTADLMNDKRLVNVPDRPIISNCGTPTEGIFEYVDFNLKLVVAQIPQIIRDTSDFINRLKNFDCNPETRYCFLWMWLVSIPTFPTRKVFLV